MENFKSHLQHALKSILAYGLGLGFGIVITGLLYRTVDISGIGLKLPPELLFIGLGIALFIEAIGSGIGGAIGGLSLPLPSDKQISQWGKAWRSGLSMGLLFSTVLFLTILLVFFLNFYGRYDLETGKFSLFFALAGAIFGVLIGLLLGLLLVRKHGVWHVALASLIGFGIGGLGLGYGLHRYLLTIETANLQSGNRLWLVFGFSIFGLVGGAALGFVFSYLSEKTLSPRESKWWHWAVAGGLVLLAVVAVMPILTAAAEMLTPVDANLSSVFESRTSGTHWSNSFALSESMSFSGEPQEASMAANSVGQLAVGWSQSAGEGSGVYWLPGEWLDDTASWRTPVKISDSL